MVKETFLENSRLYEEAIRRRVCSKCIDWGEDGKCHGPDPEGCAIFRFLPKLVALAERIKESRIEPYVQALRHDICDHCDHQSPNGSCSLRDSLECGLDRYLSLVLDAIDEVKMKEERSLWRQL